MGDRSGFRRERRPQVEVFFTDLTVALSFGFFVSTCLLSSSERGRPREWSLVPSLPPAGPQHSLVGPLPQVRYLSGLLGVPAPAPGVSGVLRAGCTCLCPHAAMAPWPLLTWLSNRAPAPFMRVGHQLFLRKCVSFKISSWQVI